ncbi:hypothetical protein KLP40_14785 [Hymenobacter sp. NST-14]|uniref:hypothetical protein n=1 Tax=Hymenobacter piscis TaxID=2839984 RepID=UPI001C02E9BA|nr:hypothetical protein [Hymenobacter piscis]MBT9394435.1 hypothetical protein [Hymenobacter piscis]
MDSLQKSLIGLEPRDSAALGLREIYSLYPELRPDYDVVLDHTVIKEAAAVLDHPFSGHWNEYASITIVALISLMLVFAGWALCAYVFHGLTQRLTFQVDELKRQMTEVNRRQHIDSFAIESWRKTRPLLQQRDRLLRNYQFAKTLSSTEYNTWHRLMWKEYAQCTLNLIRAVRPLTYLDYRHRILAWSPTYDPTFRRFQSGEPTTDSGWENIPLDARHLFTIAAGPPQRHRFTYDLENVFSAMLSKQP